MTIASPQMANPLSSDQLADLRLTASKMPGDTQRRFEAEMALKYIFGLYSFVLDDSHAA